MDWLRNPAIPHSNRAAHIKQTMSLNATNASVVSDFEPCDIFGMSDTEVASACTFDEASKRDAWLGDAQLKLMLSERLHAEQPPLSTSELTTRRARYEANAVMAAFLREGTTLSPRFLGSRILSTHALGTVFEVLFHRSSRQRGVVREFCAWVDAWTNLEVADELVARETLDSLAIHTGTITVAQMVELRCEDPLESALIQPLRQWKLQLEAAVSIQSAARGRHARASPDAREKKQQAEKEKLTVVLLQSIMRRWQVQRVEAARRQAEEQARQRAAHALRLQETAANLSGRSNAQGGNHEWRGDDGPYNVGVHGRQTYPGSWHGKICSNCGALRVKRVLNSNRTRISFTVLGLTECPRSPPSSWLEQYNLDLRSLPVEPTGWGGLRWLRWKSQPMAIGISEVRRLGFSPPTYIEARMTVRSRAYNNLRLVDEQRIVVLSLHLWL